MAEHEDREMKRGLTAVTAFSAAPGLVAAVIAMCAAWDHNPQGEFHELPAHGTQLVHWGELGKVGLAWFVVEFAPLFLCGGILLAFHYRRGVRRPADD